MVGRHQLRKTDFSHYRVHLSRAMSLGASESIIYCFFNLSQLKHLSIDWSSGKFMIWCSQTTAIDIQSSSNGDKNT